MAVINEARIEMMSISPARLNFVLSRDLNRCFSSFLFFFFHPGLFSYSIRTVRGSFTEDSFDKGHMDLFSQRKNKLRILRILLDSF